MAEPMFSRLFRYIKSIDITKMQPNLGGVGSSRMSISLSFYTICVVYGIACRQTLRINKMEMNYEEDELKHNRIKYSSRYQPSQC